VAGKPEVTVLEDEPGVFTVEVHAARTTTHQVTVPQGYGEQVGAAGATDQQLVAASFAFLLEREPSSSILTRFRLDRIADYFPEYPREICRYLA
jgi:hypothetical protein